MATTSRRTLPLAALGATCLLLTACGDATPRTPRTTTITITPPASSATPSATPSAPSTSVTAPTTGPPKSYDEALAHLATGRVDPKVTSAFTSPTGNISCRVSGPPRGCELRTGRIAPPTPASCPAGGAKDIGRVEYAADGPRAVCNSDTIIEPGAPVLGYGSLATPAGTTYQCLSESIGVTCVDTAQKKGFFLARDTYVIF